MWLLDLPVPFVGLADGHDPQDRCLIPVMFDEERVAPGDMQTVPAAVQFFKIATGGPFPIEPGDMLPHDTAIFLRQVPQEFDNARFYLEHVTGRALPLLPATRPKAPQRQHRDRG